MGRDARPRAYHGSAAGDEPHVMTPRLIRRTTTELTPDELVAIRDLLWAAFPSGEEAFTEDDWQHAIGGQHFLADVDGTIVSHASVVERELHVAGRPIRTGYVEAVGTAPNHQGRGHGSAVMRDATAYVRETFELGALATGAHGFYERMGWQTWRGPTFVRASNGPRRTPEEDGFILVLLTPTSPPIDITTEISCDWRPGDVW
jgi:aminoglycoside 2'-N-acetyltransferase I